MGFKVIETEEEIRSAYLAGLLHWKTGSGQEEYCGKFVGRTVDEVVQGWRTRDWYRSGNDEWEACILVEED